MSTREKLPPQQVITNGDMSQASVTSSATVILGMSLISYQVTWSGSTPVGTVAVQTSNTYSLYQNGTVNNAGSWNTLPLEDSTGAIVTSLPVTGNTGSLSINVAEMAAYAIRLVYTKTSGTGTIQAYITGKVS